MIATNYTTEDLKKLPLRAIVAFAGRCARRVEPLALLPDDHPDQERCRSALRDAIRMAEDFARGLPVPPIESVVRAVEESRVVVEGERVRDSALSAVVLTAHAAASALHALDLRDEPGESCWVGAAPPANPFPHLADVTADLAARDAFTAALEAAGAVGHTDRFIHGVVRDYQRLLQLNLGSYPQAGQAIDPAPEGPLGPL